MLNKFFLFAKCLYGYIHKFLIDVGIYNIPTLGQHKEVCAVVSLTSYGRRVKTNVVYYTLVSILRQTVHPSHIILWLSKEEWSDDTIPPKLYALKKKGVEIRYCKDIRSYKKLVPTKELYPKDVIVTMDDDLIYSDDVLETLYNSHLSHPESIICLNANIPVIKNGVPVSYETWEKCKFSQEGKTLFPIGVGGVLYPSNSLNKDAFNESLFEKLCPFADDVWFWFNGLRNSTNKLFVVKKKSNYAFDDIYQYFHKGSALTHSNRFEHQNNDQINNIFNYFNVRLNEAGDLVNKG